MNKETVKVWDPAVRFFHWSLVLFFTIAYLSGEEAEGLHVYSGYIVLGLVLFRVLWGFIGTRHARFSDFIYGPADIINYLKELFSGRPKRYLGHNPAGGLMVVGLLAVLLLTTVSGLKTYGAEGHGPLAGLDFNPASVAYANGDDYDDDHENGEEFWEEVHEFMAGFTLFLVVVHVAGAVVASVLHRENFIKAMITGRKTVEGP